MVEAEQSLILPPATFELATQKLSKLYKNVIFDDSNTDESFDGTKWHDKTKGAFVELSRGRSQSHTLSRYHNLAHLASNSG